MRIPMFQVDAFTSRIFGGNPAAVCVLETLLDDETLQNIAAENNLSETAFLVEHEGSYGLRWFTPKLEIDLCGHATLASAFVVFSFLNTGLSCVHFDTASGLLTVEKRDNFLSMDFPARPPVRYDPGEALAEALGARPKEVYKARDILAVFEQEAQIREMRPDFEKIAQRTDAFAVIVSAPGNSVDFVSRFFAPSAGIPEDPVTGSAHCTLIPFWAERLGRSKLRARQLSSRGGELICEHLNARVKIGGRAVLYSKGEIIL